MHSEPSGHSDRALPSQTDAELFLALKSGQTDALGILYDRHAGLVHGLALKLLGNTQEAEDLVQDIFLNLDKSSYDGQRGTLKTFLTVLTRSRAIDRLRSRKVALRFMGRSRPSRSQDTASNPPLEHVYQSEQAQEVQSALDQLSDSQRQILKLSYYDGLSQSEIAQRLQIPLGTVKTAARRGLLKLRQSLSDYLR